MSGPGTIAPSGWGQIALGVLVAAGGLLVIWRSRSAARRGAVPLRIASDVPVASGLSLPTRLVIGVVLIIAGYHLAIWAVPEQETLLQLPRRWWWVWMLIGLGSIPASFGLDSLERKRSGRGGTGLSERP